MDLLIQDSRTGFHRTNKFSKAGNISKDSSKGFDFIIDEGTPPVRGVIPFNAEHFMLIGYSAKGGVNVELKVRNPQTT